MGQVYEARHARLPGRFAVKVLANADVGRSDFLRFRREAEIASSLRHPHIVQIIDFNEDLDGSPYLVMEYLDGRDLAPELGAVSPPATMGTSFTGVTSYQEPTRWRGDGSAP
jgi:eukaryotic-like serine/threonine-protein kinase